MEELRYAAGATLFSLFFNAVFTLWMLFLINGVLRRFVPEIALETRELAAIYIMVNMVTALCNYDMLPMLPPIMTYAFWGATPENEWRELFHRDLPQWLVVDDSFVLSGYYRGEATLYTTANLAAWLPPLLWWSCFTIVVFFVMLCINTVVRKQWVETEKLAYPIAEIPLTLVQSASYNRLLWIGFAIACGINVVNGLHFLYPSLPGLTIFKRQHIGSIFTDKPWTGLRAMRISFIPSMIGLSFFVPLDLLFFVLVFLLLLARNEGFGRHAILANLSCVWPSCVYSARIGRGISGGVNHRNLAGTTTFPENHQESARRRQQCD